MDNWYGLNLVQSIDFGGGPIWSHGIYFVRDLPNVGVYITPDRTVSIVLVDLMSGLWVWEND